MNKYLKKHLANFLSLVLFVSVTIVSHSQDGEKLFKANCASCHHPIKNATGPKMQGVLQKWEDNGEGDLIYEWVKNPAELYNSGKSKMAKAIWDWSPTVMTPQGHLSKDEVKSIFAYVDAYAPPATAQGPASDDTVYEAEDDTVSYWWWIIIGLMVFVLFATFGVRRELSEVIAAKEGQEVDPKKTFIVSARQWALRNWFVTVLMIVAVALFSGIELFGRLYQVGVYQDYQPSQPIAYSHKLHAGNMGIECKYCHHSAEKSKHAGIPSVNVCMNCHAVVHEGPQYGTEEIDKIHLAAGYNKAKQAYNLDANGTRIEQPLVWNKAHNLPDHVYFSHAQHVHPNTGNIDCRQCHGPVQNYTLGRVSTTDEVNAYASTDEGMEKGIIQLTKPILTMGWCIECHNKKEIDLASTGYYEEIHNRLKSRADVHNNILEDDKVTVKELGGWECAKCHY
ncbi:MAG: c-type cytochrome [Bacteroidota bacterium]|nr:c-type cytochrome [Bacteroidota bacterium]